MAAHQGVQRTVIILLCIMVVLVGGVVSRILLSPETKVALDAAALQQQGAFIRPQPKLLKDFQLIDADQQEVSVDTFKGRWSLVFLGYTQCPDICPTTMGLFKQLHKSGPSRGLADIQYVLLSADPQRDTPLRLREYLQFFNQDFVGITGSVAQVAAFAKQLNALFAKAPQQAGDYLIDHSANMMIINPAGQFHGFIRPPHSVEQIQGVMAAVIGAY